MLCRHVLEFVDQIILFTFYTACTHFALLYLLCRHIRLNTVAGEENIQYQHPSKKHPVPRM